MLVDYCITVKYSRYIMCILKYKCINVYKYGYRNRKLFFAAFPQPQFATAVISQYC